MSRENSSQLNFYRSALNADFSRHLNNVNFLDFYEFFKIFIAGEFYNTAPNANEWLKVENLFFSRMLDVSTIYVSYQDGQFELWEKDEKKSGVYLNLKTKKKKAIPSDWLVAYSFPIPNLLNYIFRMCRLEADLFNNYKNSLIIKGKAYTLTTNSTDRQTLTQEVENILNPEVPFFFRFNDLLEGGSLPASLERINHQPGGLSFDDILNFNNYWVSKTGFDVFKINKRERLISAELEENKRANSNILFYILRSLQVFALEIFERFGYVLEFNNDQSTEETNEESQPLAAEVEE